MMCPVTTSYLDLIERVYTVFADLRITYDCDKRIASVGSYRFSNAVKKRKVTEKVAFARAFKAIQLHYACLLPTYKRIIGIDPLRDLTVLQRKCKKISDDEQLLDAEEYLAWTPVPGLPDYQPISSSVSARVGMLDDLALSAAALIEHRKAPSDIHLRSIGAALGRSTTRAGLGAVRARSALVSLLLVTGAHDNGTHPFT